MYFFTSIDHNNSTETYNSAKLYVYIIFSGAKWNRKESIIIYKFFDIQLSTNLFILAVRKTRFYEMSAYPNGHVLFVSFKITEVKHKILNLFIFFYYDRQFLIQFWIFGPESGTVIEVFERFFFCNNGKCMTLWRIQPNFVLYVWRWTIGLSWNLNISLERKSIIVIYCTNFSIF